MLPLATHHSCLSFPRSRATNFFDNGTFFLNVILHNCTKVNSKCVEFILNMLKLRFVEVSHDREITSSKHNIIESNKLVQIYRNIY